MDKAGNSASATISNVNIDKTAPTITFVSRTPANSYGWNNTDVTMNWSCSDGLSGPVSPSDSHTLSGEGANQSSAGTCNDRAGNSASNTQTGINIDKTAPTLSPGVAPNRALLNGAATVSSGASDSLSGIATQSCGTLDLASVGSKSVSCTATDKAGNINSKLVSYSVIYASGGVCYGDVGHQILQPINVNGTSVGKQGRTSPAKFRVYDANGVSIGAPGVVSSFVLTAIKAGTATTVNEEVPSTTPDTAFRWFPTDQLWIFNISTKSQSAGKTYVYTITLNDGSPIGFQYGLR